MNELKKAIEQLFDDETNEFIREYCDATNTDLEEFTRMSIFRYIDWVRKANLTLGKLIEDTPKEVALSRVKDWD